MRQKGWSVRIIVFNMDVGSTLVDGALLRQADTSTIPYDELVDVSQLDVDEDISAKCAAHGCGFKYDAVGWVHMSRNAMRQMYTEMLVGHFLEREGNAFDVAVVLNGDLVFPLPISTVDVQAAANAAASGQRIVYTTGINDAGGFTDSFYFGGPRSLSTVLRRYAEFERYAHIQNDNEAVLKAAFEAHGISRRVTRAAFFKVRASGDGPPFQGVGLATGARHVEWQGGPGLPLSFDTEERAQVLREARHWRATCFHHCPNEQGNHGVSHEACFSERFGCPRAQAELAFGSTRSVAAAQPCAQYAAEPGKCPVRCVSDVCRELHERADRYIRSTALG